MFFQYAISGQEPSGREGEESQFWAEQLARYREPFRERLDAYLDRRVVGNLLAGVGAIVQSRSALTTSELGCAICGADHAEAGTIAPAVRLAPSGLGGRGDRRGLVGAS